jgi:hypothetical protein
MVFWIEGTTKMKTVTEHIRDHLLRRIERLPALEALEASEWSPAFERAMRARMVQGAFRYGRMTSGRRRYDRVKQMRERLARYVETGDKEMLVDLANFALLEWEEQ